MTIEESLRDSLRRINGYARARDHILKALEEIENAKTGGSLAGAGNTPHLTKRERELYKMLSEGLEPREIAEKTGRALKTVEAQRDTLRKKLGFETAAALTKAARETK